jgi:hypothetical protein
MPNIIDYVLYNILREPLISVRYQIGCSQYSMTALFNQQMQIMGCMMYDADKVRELNDTARQTFTCCRVMVTRGVAALDCVDAVLAAVRRYSTFNADNDPYGEHDFGSFRLADETVFWKFDYYDVNLQMASPDPADEAVTVRVLTIMLAEEY